MNLSLQEKTKLAETFGIPLPNMLAVISVESQGNGFLADGRIKILFEAHKFSSFTGHIYDTTHPDISSLKWNPLLYKGGGKEWDRLEAAMKLNTNAALLSASYGAGQTMGFNYEICGFPNINAMISAYQGSEYQQYIGMLNYIKHVHGCIEAIRNQDWATFAFLYNGKGYHDNEYDIKLKKAFDHLK